MGIGLSVLVPAVTTVALNSVEGKHSGLASAINNAFSQTAALLAIAILGVLMFATFDSSVDGRLADLGLPSEARQQLEEEKIDLGAVEVPEGLDPELATTVERAVDEAFVVGYRAVMLVAAALAMASALSAALLIESKKNRARGASAETRAFAVSSRLATEYPAEIQKVEDAVSS